MMMMRMAAANGDDLWSSAVLHVVATRFLHAVRGYGSLMMGRPFAPAQATHRKKM